MDSKLPKILLILPYFGKLPPNWLGFVDSCKDNSNIDFLFVGDCFGNNAYSSSNIRVLPMSWEDMQLLVKTTLHSFGYKRVCLPYPYKLCDYKPTYGVLFSKYVEGYDYWGYIDCDLIFGNLSKYLLDIDIYKYDRVWRLGHLSIYRNEKSVNELFTQEFKGVLSFKNVCNNTLIYNFDEGAINEYFKLAKMKFYENSDDATFGIFCPEYKWRNQFNPHLGEFFVKSKDGSTYAYTEQEDGTVICQEVNYIHFLTKKNISIPDNFPRPYYIIKDEVGGFSESKITDLIKRTRTTQEIDNKFAKKQILLFRKASIKKVIREIRVNKHRFLIQLIRRIPSYIMHSMIYSKKIK